MKLPLVFQNWVRILACALVGAAMLSGTSGRAMAANVLYATGTGTSGTLSALYSINPATGAATLLFGIPSIHIYGGGLAYDAASDSLFATGADDSSREALYRIDRFAGTASLVGFTGVPAVLSQGGASINPLTGVLYAVGSNAGPNSGFYSIDKTTGAATHIGQASGPFTGLYGLGFRQDGALFANGFDETAGSKLFSVDPASGASALIGAHGDTFGRQLEYSGLAFGNDGTLYSLGSISGSESGLYSVNPLTGNATPIGSTVLQFGVDGGLAFAPGTPVPEPSSFAGLVIAALDLLRRSKRRHARK